MYKRQARDGNQNVAQGVPVDVNTLPAFSENGAPPVAKIATAVPAVVALLPTRPCRPLAHVVSTQLDGTARATFGAALRLRREVWIFVKLACEPGINASPAPNPTRVFTDLALLTCTDGTRRRQRRRFSESRCFCEVANIHELSKQMAKC